MPQTIFCANGCAGDDVAADEATTLFADRKSAENVNIPSTAVRKSLSKRRKTREKGRDSCSRRLEISTQNAENGRKGRDSQYCRL